MKKLYICYDGVDCDITYHDTEEQALEKLKKVVSESLDCGEWVDVVENSFVAKITHKIDQVKIEMDAGDEDEEERCNMEYYDMVVKAVVADKQ